MARCVKRAAVCAAALLLSSACRGGASRSHDVAVDPGGEPRILLTQRPPGSALSAIDVVGLPADFLARLEQHPPRRDQWAAILRVTVAGPKDHASDRPAVLGAYSI